MLYATLMGLGERSYGLAEWNRHDGQSFLRFHAAMALWPMNYRIRERMAALASATPGLAPQVVRGMVAFALRHDPNSPTLLVYSVVVAINARDRVATDAALDRLAMVAAGDEAEAALTELRRVYAEIWTD